VRVNKTLEEDRKTAGNYIFTVYGVPVAQARAGRRHFIAGGRACSQAYDPGKSKSWKQDVKAQVIAQMVADKRGAMLAAVHKGPVVLDLFFYMPRPVSLPQKYRHHIKKPDRDNLEKSVKDALKGILWKDDSQVVDGRTRKVYGDRVCVVIAVRMITQEDDLDALPTEVK